MNVRKLLFAALSLVSFASFSPSTAEPRSPSQVCFDTYLGCQGNSMKCSDPRKCQARCEQKVKQCLAKAQGGGKRTTSAGNGAGVGAGNTKNVPGTKTGVNTNAGAASGTTINASGAKSAPAQQMPSTKPNAGGGGGAGQPPRSRRM
jgi:hypothetical protein